MPTFKFRVTEGSNGNAKAEPYNLKKYNEYLQKNKKKDLYFNIRQERITRSEAQNNYLQGVVIRKITNFINEGWMAGDPRFKTKVSHDMVLGMIKQVYLWRQIQYYTINGVQVLTEPSTKKIQNKNPDNDMHVVVWNDFITQVQKDWAEQGLYIPDPNEPDAQQSIDRWNEEIEFGI